MRERRKSHETPNLSGVGRSVKTREGSSPAAPEKSEAGKLSGGIRRPTGLNPWRKGEGQAGSPDVSVRGGRVLRRPVFEFSITRLDVLSNVLSERECRPHWVEQVCLGRNCPLGCTSLGKNTC